MRYIFIMQYVSCQLEDGHECSGRCVTNSYKSDSLSHINFTSWIRFKFRIFYFFIDFVFLSNLHNKFKSIYML